jgi:hypothetical protein
MMSSATSCSTAVMESVPRRRRTISMIEPDKWTALQEDSAINLATTSAQLVKGAVFSRLP